MDLHDRDTERTNDGDGRAMISDAVQEALRDAVAEMPKLISRSASAANRYCQVLRSSVEERPGEFSVQVTVVPIGGSDLRPEQHGLMLRQTDGDHVAVECFSERNWTATFREVPEGRYDVSVFSLVLDEPARILLRAGTSKRVEVACAAPTRRPNAEAATGQLRFTARRNEAGNSIEIQVATDSPKIIGMHCLTRILDDRDMRILTDVSREPVEEDYWAEGRHGAEPVIEVGEAAISSELRVRVDPIALDAEQDETAEDQ
jgi:hypothetical protein